ncbi:hypothetical protein MJT46_011631 [Ovis ammon polii x Ovis aries]|nr:hypothetical protein MJT46_011631 [Ovis ammon polii x Ovis aries]
MPPSSLVMVLLNLPSPFLPPMGPIPQQDPDYRAFPEQEVREASHTWSLVYHTVTGLKWNAYASKIREQQQKNTTKPRLQDSSLKQQITDKRVNCYWQQF